MTTTYTREQLINALTLCALSIDAETILHVPTGTRFRFPELRGTTVIDEPVRDWRGKVMKDRLGDPVTRERILTVEEELALRIKRIDIAIHNIRKQPKKLWEPRQNRAAA